MDTIEELRMLVQKHPLIDQHAYRVPNLNLTEELSEEQADMMMGKSSKVATLATQRALHQLQELYGEPCDTWDDVHTARSRCLTDNYDEFVQRCLQGTHMLLLTDVDLVPGEVVLQDWPKQFTTSESKKIVCIETVAEEVLQKLMNEQRQANTSVLNQFRTRFIDAINDFMNDAAVVAFQTDICHRSGLDVDPYSPDDDTMTAALHRILDLGNRSCGYCVTEKPILDWMVVQIMKLNSSGRSSSKTKPLQFSTALADDPSRVADFETRPVSANPVLLEPLLQRYLSKVVLLNAGYPYTKEACLVANRHRAVHLDLGGIFPAVSRDGQERVLREVFETMPNSRLLWSTHGNHHPESFWLANKQLRQALERVLVDYVACGDLSIPQAKELAADILFRNANRLYSLGQMPDYEM
ncbi:Protein fluG [Penicillium diatomitis]|uniref:Protein fluG n=1 Tax=Penicillium diatomitis TaxID=2819901 RepID=A0A9X0BJV0_9EURO|nr:Protein fluG [Penicillium diatomitis]KAJ5469718.1 Protein fluG [Penicillium diatomitis]